MRQQTRGVLAGGLIAGALVVGSAGAVLAGTAPGTSSRDIGDSGYSGMMSAYGSGSVRGSYGSGGMMGNSGPGGMMGAQGPGGLWGNCDPTAMMGNAGPGGMMGSGSPGTRLTLDQAQQNMQRYIARFGNRNLAIDEVMEFQRNFYAIVKDKSTGHGAFEVLVNKVTGQVFPEYGPAMMWNTTYGMMGYMRGYEQPKGPMAISPVQATRIARQWLRQNQPGATTEAPDQFPGYYTLHILKNGRVTGMLSVNGYTGQVWYHTWHGALIRMKDLHA